MAQIIVTSDPPAPRHVVYTERVEAGELTSAHFTRQLVQRLAWAAEDAAAGEGPAEEDAAAPDPPARPVHEWTPSEP